MPHQIIPNVGFHSQLLKAFYASKNDLYQQFVCIKLSKEKKGQINMILTLTCVADEVSIYFAPIVVAKSQASAYEIGCSPLD